MDKPPMEWIDKLFVCLSDWYGERWTRQFDKFMPEPMAKLVWQSALTGCSYEEIRGALVLLRQAAKNTSSLPPHQMEFFRVVKGDTQLLARPQAANDEIHRNAEIARAAIHEIKSKLKFKNVS